MEISSKRILYEKNAREKQLIASTTKIMTAIIVIELGNENDVIEVGHEVLSMYGTNIYLEVGEKIKVKDLLYGLMLRSGNDAAIVLAKYIGGTEEQFVKLMNEKANEIGMYDTEFHNAHGLDELTQNFSTAYDMALLSVYAYNNNVYRTIASTKTYKTSSDKKSYKWSNRNTLLTTYKYCTSGKNGYTPKAGKTLVTTASKNGMDTTAVTLNVSDSYNRHKELYEEIYEKYDNTLIVNKEKFIIPYEYVENTLELQNSFYYPLTSSEKKAVQTKIFINSSAVSKDNGYVEVKLKDQTIGTIPIIVKQKKEDINIFLKIKNYLLEILNKLILGLQNNLNPAPLVPSPLEIYKSLFPNL